MKNCDLDYGYVARLGHLIVELSHRVLSILFLSQNLEWCFSEVKPGILCQAATHLHIHFAFRYLAELAVDACYVALAAGLGASSVTRATIRPQTKESTLPREGDALLYFRCHRSLQERHLNDRAPVIDRLLECEPS